MPTYTCPVLKNILNLRLGRVNQAPATSAISAWVDSNIDSNVTKHQHSAMLTWVLVSFALDSAVVPCHA
jgi:hypothetical protein